MDTPLHHRMKVGIIHFMAYPSTIGGEGPVYETVKKIVEDTYFDAISVSWIKDVAVRKNVARLLGESRLEVAYGAHPRLLSQKLNLNHLDTNERRKAVDEIKAGIDEAVEIGAKSVVLLSGPWEKETEEDSFKALVESTLELCDYAQQNGNLPIIHENFDHSIDKKSLIGPTPLALRYAQEVTKEKKNFGLAVDLSHIPLIGEKPEEALPPVKDYLATVDIGNCVLADTKHPRYGDTHPRFGAPGGENDVPELVAFLKVLQDIGFFDREERPVVSFEIRPFGDEDPEAYIANAKRTLNEAWRRL